MVSLWDRPWSRAELLARVGRLEQVAGVQLAEAADGAESGVRLLRFTTGSRCWWTAGSTSAGPGWAASRWPGGPRWG